MSDNSGGSSGLGGGGIAGIIIAILVIGAIAAFFVVKKKKSRTSREEHFEQHQPFKFGSNDVKGIKRLAVYITWQRTQFPSMYVSNNKNLLLAVSTLQMPSLHLLHLCHFNHHLHT